MNPGWYMDPDNRLQQRYWDGQDWTTHTRAKPTAFDPWQPNDVPPSLTEKPEAPALSETRHDLQPGMSGGKKFLIIACTVIAVSLMFQSCGVNRGWQMGVDGNGYQVTCVDGATSMSGGKQGACSHHGGVR